MPTEKSELTAALAKVQAKLPEIVKGQTADAGQYTYTYADLAAVSKAIVPRLGENGLAWVTRPTLSDGRFVLAYELRHTSGESLSGEYPLSGTTPQQVGSAITYARRYCLCSVTGIAPEADDDDAHAVRDKPYSRPAFHEGTSRHAPEEPPNPIPSDAQVEEFGRLRKLILAADDPDALAAAGLQVQAAVKAGEILPNQYERLKQHGQVRKVALEAAADLPAAEPTPEKAIADA